MHISKLAKNMLNYLPVVAVLAAMVLGLFLGRDLYPTLSTETNNPPGLIILGAEGPCPLSNIYTSLPPKCKTLDGKFIPVPGTLPNLFVIHEGK